MRTVLPVRERFGWLARALNTARTSPTSKVVPILLSAILETVLRHT